MVNEGKVIDFGKLLQFRQGEKDGFMIVFVEGFVIDFIKVDIVVQVYVYGWINEVVMVLKFGLWVVL